MLNTEEKKVIINGEEYIVANHFPKMDNEEYARYKEKIEIELHNILTIRSETLLTALK